MAKKIFQMSDTELIKQMFDSAYALGCSDRSVGKHRRNFLYAGARVLLKLRKVENNADGLTIVGIQEEISKIIGQ